MNTDNKLVKVFKSNRLLLIVAAVYLAVLVISPEMAFKSISNSMYYLKEMLIIMPVIFLLTVVIEALVPRDVIVRSFGEKSGVKGNILALILGSISAGPVYAAFPVSKMLLAKGASVGNIVIVLSAWAVVKLPMLANEARFLGVNFMVVRWILTVAAIFIMALVVGKAVKKKDLPAEPELMTGKSPALSINDSCIGCGLCARVAPEYFVMQDKKADVIKQPRLSDDKTSVQQSVDKCPVQAIEFKQKNAS
ncbi:MAG: hypothetical protein PWP10_3764 [Clostridiales bacterium]|jgi:ferredoxin|nr:hypothetical protein [Clostridiales bacterium]